MKSFLIRVNATEGERGRLMHVRVQEDFPIGDDDFCPVDVRDSETRMESQALPTASVAADPLTLMADTQVRDCVRSVWMSATTTWDNGHIAKHGEHLPDGFPIEVQTPAMWNKADITPDPDDGSTR